MRAGRRLRELTFLSYRMGRVGLLLGLGVWGGEGYASGVLAGTVVGRSKEFSSVQFLVGSLDGDRLGPKLGQGVAGDSPGRDRYSP